jgi:hypothetical protein
VQSPNEDVTAPTLTSVSPPARVGFAGSDAYVQIRFSASDAGTGLSFGTLSIKGHGYSLAPDAGQGTPSSTFVATFPIGDWPAGVYEFSVFVRDAVGNYRGYTPAMLEAAGFPSRVTITR